MRNYIRAVLFKFLQPEIEAIITCRLIDFVDGLIERGQIPPIKAGSILGDGVVYSKDVYALPKPHIVTKEPTNGKM
jgi:hypothetical protein